MLQVRTYRPYVTFCLGKRQFNNSYPFSTMSFKDVHFDAAHTSVQKKCNAKVATLSCSLLWYWHFELTLKIAEKETTCLAPNFPLPHQWSYEAIVCTSLQFENFSCWPIHGMCYFRCCYRTDSLLTWFRCLFLGRCGNPSYWSCGRRNKTDVGDVEQRAFWQAACRAHVSHRTPKTCCWYTSTIIGATGVISPAFVCTQSCVNLIYFVENTVFYLHHCAGSFELRG